MITVPHALSTPAILCWMLLLSYIEMPGSETDWQLSGLAYSRDFNDKQDVLKFIIVNFFSPFPPVSS